MRPIRMKSRPDSNHATDESKPSELKVLDRQATLKVTASGNEGAVMDIATMDVTAQTRESGTLSGDEQPITAITSWLQPA